MLLVSVVLADSDIEKNDRWIFGVEMKMDYEAVSWCGEVVKKKEVWTVKNIPI
jgi:hypothetical protein